MATVPAEGSISSLLVFDEQGLLPCIAQDCDSGEVLMFAYMNREALELTRSTGELHLWSRSRQAIWRKGESSGNLMALRSLRLDCDGDCLLAMVQPAGPACHTGERSCFHRQAADLAIPLSSSEGSEVEVTVPEEPCEALPALERTLQRRAAERPEGSYTVALLSDPARIGEKVMEEAEEVSRAAREESDRRVDEEAADLLYHLTVLLHSRGRRLADPARVLIERAGARHR